MLRRGQSLLAFETLQAPCLHRSKARHAVMHSTRLARRLCVEKKSAAKVALIHFAAAQAARSDGVSKNCTAESLLVMTSRNLGSACNIRLNHGNQILIRKKHRLRMELWMLDKTREITEYFPCNWCFALQNRAPKNIRQIATKSESALPFEVSDVPRADRGSSLFSNQSVRLNLVAVLTQKFGGASDVKKMMKFLATVLDNRSSTAYKNAFLILAARHNKAQDNHGVVVLLACRELKWNYFIQHRAELLHRDAHSRSTRGQTAVAGPSSCQKKKKIELS